MVSGLDAYYPGLSSVFQDEEPTIIEVEKELYIIFYSIYEKILVLLLYNFKIFYVLSYIAMRSGILKHYWRNTCENGSKLDQERNCDETGEITST